jgi:hypothetical protein
MSMAGSNFLAPRPSEHRSSQTRGSAGAHGQNLLFSYQRPNSILSLVAATACWSVSNTRDNSRGSTNEFSRAYGRRSADGIFRLVVRNFLGGHPNPVTDGRLKTGHLSA